MKISSRLGPTITLSILPEKQFTFATKLPARCGPRRRCRFGMKTRVLYRAAWPGLQPFPCTGLTASALDLVQFVPSEDPIKISRLTLRNDSGRVRRLSVTAYAEWVLGSSRARSAPIITEVDSRIGSDLGAEHLERRVRRPRRFADLGGGQTSFTGDRTEFLGRNGTPERPAALESDGPLSEEWEQALDPCAALQTVGRIASRRDR